MSKVFSKVAVKTVDDDLGQQDSLYQSQTQNDQDVLFCDVIDKANIKSYIRHLLMAMYPTEVIDDSTIRKAMSVRTVDTNSHEFSHITIHTEIPVAPLSNEESDERFIYLFVRDIGLVSKQLERIYLVGRIKKAELNKRFPLVDVQETFGFSDFSRDPIVLFDEKGTNSCHAVTKNKILESIMPAPNNKEERAPTSFSGIVSKITASQKRPLPIETSTTTIVSVEPPAKMQKVVLKVKKIKQYWFLFDPTRIPDDGVSKAFMASHNIKELIFKRLEDFCFGTQTYHIETLSYDQKIREVADFLVCNFLLRACAMNKDLAFWYVHMELDYLETTVKALSSQVETAKSNLNAAMKKINNKDQEEEDEEPKKMRQTQISRLIIDVQQFIFKNASMRCLVHCFCKDCIEQRGGVI